MTYNKDNYIRDRKMAKGNANGYAKQNTFVFYEANYIIGKPT